MLCSESGPSLAACLSGICILKQGHAYNPQIIQAGPREPLVLRSLSIDSRSVTLDVLARRLMRFNHTAESPARPYLHEAVDAGAHHVVYGVFPLDRVAYLG